MQPQRATAGGEVCERSVQVGEVRRQRGELVDDDDESGRSRLVIEIGAGTRPVPGEKPLAIAQLCREAGKRPGRTRLVEIGDQPDRVRQCRDVAKRRPALEVE